MWGALSDERTGLAFTRLISFRHGPRSENTRRTQYPSNYSIAIEACLICRCIETAVALLLSANSLQRECV
jgi:hypothetical protein